jgi:hypothetical protein
MGLMLVTMYHEEHEAHEECSSMSYQIGDWLLTYMKLKTGLPMNFNVTGLQRHQAQCFLRPSW